MKCIFMNKNTEIALLEYNELLHKYANITKMSNNRINNMPKQHFFSYIKYL